MANAYVSTASNSLGGTVGAAGLVQKAYDRLIEFALRAQPLIRSVADKTPARQSIPGSSVVLQRYVDLTQNTASLTETVDPDAVAMATPTYTTITLVERGNAVLVTRALELFSLADVDPAIANIIAFNMADSLDTVAQNVLADRATGSIINGTANTGTTNVFYGGSATTSSALTSSDVFTSAIARKVTAKLRANKAIPRKGSLYWAGIHPEVALDLRAETGVGSWRQPHEYQSNENIWAGELGTYEGAFYVESPRLFSNKTGADRTALATTSVTVAGTSGGTTLGVASSSTIATTAQPGDKISGTGIASGALITDIATEGSTSTITVSIAHTAAVTATTVITVTPETKVFNTYFCGQQALAEAVAEEPHVVIGPVVDKLMRHRPLGWYGVLGQAIYRQEALYRVETSSSVNFV
jgi:N4-gp56 family major capsid protein